MASKSMAESRRRGEAKVAKEGTKGAVIVVGGSGGISERYRAIVAERGLELRHFENRVPHGTRRIVDATGQPIDVEVLEVQAKKLIKTAGAEL